jgi:hypothetical protein
MAACLGALHFPEAGSGKQGLQATVCSSVLEEGVAGLFHWLKQILLLSWQPRAGRLTKRGLCRQMERR